MIKTYTDKLLASCERLLLKKSKTNEYWQDNVAEKFFFNFNPENYRKNIQTYIDVCENVERKADYAKKRIDDLLKKQRPSY